MSGYQFMHVEGFGRSGSKLKGAKRAKKGGKRTKSTGGWSAREILAEARREPQACHHVEHPLPPELLFGDLDKLTNEIELLGDPPKGIRKDTPVLIACVASAPWHPGDPRSSKWRADALKHFQKKFGDNLRSVIAHNDEEYDHMHFFITLPSYEPIKSLHQGMKARDETEASGAAGYDVKAAYVKAMKDWQDEYSIDVGLVNGQTRMGPKRQRLTRPEWQAQQQNAEHTALALKAIEQARESARIASESVTQRTKAMEAEALAMAAKIEMEALQVRGQVNAHAEAEEARLTKVKASLDAERARQAAERERQATERERHAGLIDALKKEREFDRVKSEQLAKKEKDLQDRVFEVEKKTSLLDGLLSDFYSTIAKIHGRMTQVDRGMIEHLLSAVDQVKARFARFSGKSTEKAKSGLDL